MTRRKIVLFVVEGPTDADLLLPVFNAMLTRHNAYSQEFHCDMLTAPNHREKFRDHNGFYPSETNPLDTVRDLVIRYLKRWEYSPKYLECVLQVCDLDGAFIPDDHVRADPARPDITYLPEHVRARTIGRVFQDPMKGTAPHMTIEENLSLAHSRSTARALSFAPAKKEIALFRDRLSDGRL